MAKRKRQLAPVLYLVAGIVAVVAVLNFMLGSPMAKWFAAESIYSEPLWWTVGLMLLVVVVPIVLLVYMGEDEDNGES
jgi:hypothetical protein